MRARRPRVLRTCEQCQAEFLCDQNVVDLGRGRFCSTPCLSAYRTGRERVPFVERFWLRVLKTKGCWLWTGYRDHNGYGSIGRPGASDPMKAHRASWEIHFGPIPPGVGVLHSCDNPPCVRPDHLFLGDQLANVGDAAVKGRIARGERVSGARLNPVAVIEIRGLYASGEYTYASLAALFSVGPATIADIIVGRTWKHLETT